MSDLISRQAAMNIFAVDLAEKDRQVSYQGFCIDAVMAIDSLPSAEKTGEWLIPQRRGAMSWNEKAYAECSVCHEVIFNARSMKFCPNCGADMREVE